MSAADASAALFRRAKELYLELDALPRERRADALAERAGCDAALIAEVRRWLAGAETGPGALVATGAAVPVAGLELKPDGWLPPSIGPYRVLRLLGEGGFGVVYLAEQTEPVRRTVAVKVLRGAWADRERASARLSREREALALMDHPGVATIFDAGVVEAGPWGAYPYVAMEHVPGEPITAFCRDRALPRRARLELFLAACDAVHHAHTKGIIHRDIKPGNVLVAEKDGRPVVKVIDFGIARAIDGRHGGALVETEGVVVGTPAYMSPEQAGGDAGRAVVDTRTDVYALGVLLFEVLTGRLPHGTDGMDLAAALREIREGEPARLGAADRSLRGDLECITAKALARSPGHRYGSASELAADVRRHLAHEAVLARGTARAYAARRFVRRHRAGVAVAGAIVLGMTAAVAGLGKGLVETRRALVRSHLDAAELASRRGSWLEVQANLDRAVAAGYPAGDVALCVQRVKAMDALNQSGAAREEIERLHAECEARGRVPAEVTLWRADLGLALGLSGGDADAEIERALATGELSEADAAYARGLLCRTVPDAIREFSLAVEADPFSVRARIMLGLSELLGGHADRANRQFELAGMVAPDHPTPALGRAFVASLAGDRAGARAALTDAKSLDEPALALAGSVLDILAKYAPKVAVAGTELSYLEVARLVTTWCGLVMQWHGLAGSGEAPLDGMRVPPVLRELVGGLGTSDIIRLILSGKRDGITYLESAARASPEAVFHYMCGLKLSTVERYEEAARYFDQAARAPSVFPGIQERAAAAAALYAGFCAKGDWESDWGRTAIRHAERCEARFENVPPDLAGYAWQVAFLSGELDTARSIAAQAIAAGVDSAAMRDRLARVEAEVARRAKEAATPTP